MKAQADELNRLARDLEKSNNKAVKERQKKNMPAKAKDVKPVNMQSFQMLEEQAQVLQDYQKKAMETITAAASTVGNPMAALAEAQICQQIENIQKAMAVPVISEADKAKMKEGIEKMQEALKTIKEGNQ